MMNITIVQTIVTRLCLPILLLSGTATAAAAAGAGADSAHKPRLIARIALPAVEGRIDHLTLDPASGHLYVAALGNNSIEMVDVRNNQFFGRIIGVKEPQGLAFDQGSNQLFVAEGEGAAFDSYDLASLSKKHTAKNLPDADNVRLDSKNKTVLVGYGTGAIAVFDIQTLKKITEVKVDGHPESFKINDAGSTIYANVPDSKKLYVIDRSTMKVQKSWRLPAEANYPMALHDQTLFIGCRKPPRLIILDATQGRVEQSIPMSGDCDDLFYDDATDKIYVSCGEGYLDVFERQSNNEFKLASRIATRPGARTSLLVPSTHRLYIAAPKRGSAEAEILVFDTQPPRTDDKPAR